MDNVDIDPDQDVRLLRYWRIEMERWLKHARAALDPPQPDCAFALKCLDLMVAARDEYIARALRINAL